MSVVHAQWKPLWLSQHYLNVPKQTQVNLVPCIKEHKEMWRIRSLIKKSINLWGQGSLPEHVWNPQKEGKKGNDFQLKCCDVCWLGVSQACSGCHCFVFMEDPSCIRAQNNSLFRCYTLQREHIISYWLLMPSCWLEEKVSVWIYSFFCVMEQKCSNGWASVTKARDICFCLCSRVDWWCLSHFFVPAKTKPALQTVQVKV